MWLVSFARVLTLAAVTVDVGAQPPSSPDQLPELITTRQTLFSIPFQIDRPSQPATEPVEIQLYVSIDRGLNWQHYTSVPPDQSDFLFRARGDAEYWFLVRTLDRSGNLRPQCPAQPGLRVVVDTAPPALSLRARQGEAGQITAEWQIGEQYPDPQSLQIQYRTDANQPWQPVAIDPQAIYTLDSTQSGAVTWLPRTSVNASRLEIRAEVADTAGNRNVSHAQVNLNRALAAAPADYDPGAFTTTWQTRQTDRQTPAFNTAPAGRPPTGGFTPYQSQQPAPGTASGSMTALANPALQDRYPPSAPTTAGTNRALAATRQQPRMVNSRVFEVEYRLESNGLPGPGWVELWGTRNGGQTWSSFGTDNDRRSPALVTVNDEGVYGFRAVLQTGRGQPERRPRTGDVPQVWIGVDLTKPYAQILSVEQTPEDQGGRLIVRWDAADRQLADRPVGLFYGGTPAGPWAPIATELKNTGRYEWPVDPRALQQIYLRMEVRDAAGNVGEFVTLKPFMLVQSGQAFGGRNSRPVGQSARSTAKRYYFR